MSAKQIVQNFYKSDALINATVLDVYLHPDVIFAEQYKRFIRHRY
jgi:hypothetical protein